MNYFELIKSVSKIKLGEAPTLFSEITDDEYNKITDEINNALEEFFLDDSHNFRRKDTTFNTVVGQQSYNHTYGVIVPNGLYLTDSDGNTHDLVFNPDYQSLKKQDTSENACPSEWTIYNDKILFYSVPDKVYTVHVAYITDNWAKNAAGVEKLIMELETDEPNFPEKYHSVLKFMALKELYYSDPVRYQKYGRQASVKMEQIIKESKGTLEKQPQVKMNNVKF